MLDENMNDGHEERLPGFFFQSFNIWVIMLSRGTCRNCGCGVGSHNNWGNVLARVELKLGDTCDGLREAGSDLGPSLTGGGSCNIS